MVGRPFCLYHQLQPWSYFFVTFGGLVQVQFTASIKNLVYELPHELLNYLRFAILGNYKKIGKYQIWVET